MLRQSPGRNQRSKGIKVKHVLQVCFLIVICFWLIYQVKHSHDKKKEFDENEAEISVSSMRTQIGDEVPKLGRKDLQPKVEETATTGKNQDEEEAAAEEEESIGEGENKHEEEQHQEEEQKFEDKEDEGKGVGEDELDEREQEKNDAEVDREEDVTEEEKGKEEGDEKENEESDPGDTNGRLESESSLEDHDEDDETANSTHEAREEHYKADDASSAVVTHETQVTADENENQDPENLNQMNKFGDESSDHEANVGENTNDSKIEEPEMIDKNPPINTAVHDVASKSEDSSLSSNSSSIDQSNDHPTFDKNAEEVISETDGSSTQNVAGEGTTSWDGSKLQNVSLDQADMSSLDASSHEGEPKLATSEKTGETDSSSEETSKPRNSSLPTMSDKSMDSSVVTEDGSGSSTTSEKLDNDEGTDVKESDASKTENQVEVQNDPIDSSDSSVTVRTDLDTLPEIQNEANNNEDAAAE